MSIKSSVYNVKAIHENKIKVNAYNPNRVATVEMKLLERSIWEDGFTMPIVCYYDRINEIYEIIDGFHRFMVFKKFRKN